LLDSTDGALEFFYPVDGGHDNPIGIFDGLLDDGFIDPRFSIEDDSGVVRDFWKGVVVAELDDTVFWEEFIDGAVDVVGDDTEAFFIGDSVRNRGLPLRAFCPDYGD